MSLIVVVQLIVAVLLVAAILLQSRGTGLGLAFGGEGNVYRTKRGLEKSLFRATIVLAVLFLGSALVNTVARTQGLPTPPPPSQVLTTPSTQPAEPPATDNSATPAQSGPALFDIPATNSTNP